MLISHQLEESVVLLTLLVRYGRFKVLAKHFLRYANKKVLKYPNKYATLPVWPDVAIFCTLGNFLKPLATIKWLKSHTFLGNFSSEIIFGNF